VNAGRDEVLRWLDETGRGTRAAASHFGISRSTIASWVRRSGTRQPRAEVSVSADLRERPAVVVRAELVQPKAPKGEAVDPAALGPVAYYEHALRQIAEDAAAARRLGHSGAVESFTRAALVARKALDEARAAASAKGPTWRSRSPSRSTAAGIGSASGTSGLEPWFRCSEARNRRGVAVGDDSETIRQFRRIFVYYGVRTVYN
jgi:hypothetical protein